MTNPHAADEPTPGPSPRKRSQSPSAGAAPWLVAGLLVGLAALLLGYFRSFEPLHDPDARPRKVAPRGALLPVETHTIDVFHGARRSAVHITTHSYKRQRLTLNVFMMEGTGTGFVWDEQGHVVTNYHVIDGAQEIYVRMYGGTTYKATRVGAAPSRDIAVLKIPSPRELEPIEVGRSANLAVGQKVFAIGNPFGLDYTLTTGVISGLGRVIPAGEGNSGEEIRGVIQTDAAINPGNSGGPLLDSSGRLIGMNTAIYSKTGAFAGVGFAIPVDDINRIVPQLIRTGHVEQVGLGVLIAQDQWTERFVKLGELPKPGVLVMDVLPGSPAAKAGIEPTVEKNNKIDWGDLIVAADGKPIESSSELFMFLDDKAAGDVVTLKVWRDGDYQKVDVTLQVLPRAETADT